MSEEDIKLQYITPAITAKWDIKKITMETNMIQQPYYSSQKTYPPRYYQRIAINRTVDAISRGKDRLNHYMLLVMTTGTGKTYTAFQIVYRLLKKWYEKQNTLSC